MPPAGGSATSPQAGVDHRRTGNDARIEGLAKAAYGRGRNSRRYDARKGVAPPVAAELRTLAGCLWHIVRRRCGNGIVLTALTLGRLREALQPKRVAPSTRDPDYLSGRSGTLGRRGLLAGRLRDARANVRTERAPAGGSPRRRRRSPTAACSSSPSSGRERAAAAEIGHELATSHHDALLRIVAPAEGAGKWANLNAALTAHPPRGFQWLLIIDDDVELPHDFLDVFLSLAERHGFRLAQPAHAFASHAAWEVTRRRPGLTARRTRFVEIGPVTAIRADAFDALLPFPDLQMGWGLDAHWAALAEQRGWKLGVIDAVPIRHTRPVAAAYPRDAAMAEADRFLAGKPYSRASRPPRCSRSTATRRSGCTPPSTRRPRGGQIHLSVRKAGEVPQTAVRVRRQRRQVHPLLLTLLTPLFRFSYGREAYVLRIGGGRRGPVLVPKSHD